MHILTCSSQGCARMHELARLAGADKCMKAVGVRQGAREGAGVGVGWLNLSDPWDCRAARAANTSRQGRTSANRPRASLDIGRGLSKLCMAAHVHKHALPAHAMADDGATMTRLLGSR